MTMTRQERLDAMRFLMGESDVHSRGIYDALTATKGSKAFRDTVASSAARSMVVSAHYANKVLDHLAAIEQQAIDAYLADVPLPPGWTEEDDGEECRYWEVVDGFPVPVERVIAGKRGMKILSFPSHWPAIPRAVLVRAAVQCAKLREQR